MARSMVNQQFLIQKEATPGTPLVNAMKRLLGIKAMPRIMTGGGETFRASGHKVPTSHQVGDLWGAWSVEGIQDFNALGFVLCCLYGLPVTTTPGGGTNARQHVFTGLAAAADAKVAYTTQYGDTTRAFQAAYGVFNSLSLGIQRGSLSFGSSLISKKPDKGATLATTGVTDVASVPIPTRGYNIFADDTWAGLGTTKLLAAYEGAITHGDKYVPDAPINSAVSGFEDLLEAEDIDYSGNLRVGFDAVGAALIDSFEAEAMKFLRLAVDGPIIEAAIPYSLKFDRSVRLTEVGEVGKAPNSPTITLPFDYIGMKDPVSGNFDRVTLVNTVASYA